MEYYIKKLVSPKEIIHFLNTVFELYEIRKRVGTKNGIVFEIRSNEQNHVIPHVHARYGEYNISIEIATEKVLAGNLPKKNQNAAVAWVIEHKEMLLTVWKDFTLSETTTMTMSNLYSKQ